MNNRKGIRNKERMNAFSEKYFGICDEGKLCFFREKIEENKKKIMQDKDPTRSISLEYFVIFFSVSLLKKFNNNIIVLKYLTILRLFSKCTCLIYLSQYTRLNS